MIRRANSNSCRVIRTLAVVLVCALALPLHAAARDNTYLFGGNVRPTQPVVGDLYASGGTITVDQAVAGDAVMAGGTITVSAPVGDDLRVASGTLTVSADVGGELLAGAGKVTIGPKVRVGGKLTLASNTVDVSGKVAGPVRVYAQSAQLSGEYESDVEIAAQSIEIAPNTVIGGNLRYASRDALKLDPSVKVAGSVSEWRGAHGEFARERERPRYTRGAPSWSWQLGLLAAGALLIAMLPRFTQSVSAALRRSPGISVLLGVALLFAIPPLIIVLLVTIIGIPVALVLLATYPLLLLIGYLMSAQTVGDLALARMGEDKASKYGWRVGFLAVGLVVLALIRWLPWIGGLVTLLALLFGVGACVLEIYRRYKGEAAAATA